MTEHSPVAQAFRWQIAGCAAMGSAFSAALLEEALADIEGGGPAATLIVPWAEATRESLIGGAVALRLLGALHDLALSGADPDLADAFPNAERAGDEAAARRAARAAFAAHGGPIAAFMRHEPQTNEVRRSACLLGGFLTVAGETGLPLRGFEMGASAGLNQLWDRYDYRLGEAVFWGDATSPVTIDTDWRGEPPPLAAQVAVVERAACDRSPVDLSDASARRRLRAYVWADQRDRMARLDAAIAEARAAQVSVEAADAVDWAPRRATPRAGAATVLYHSVFWSYLPGASQAALLASIATLGAAATPQAPFAWLRMEPAEDNMATMEVRLTLWPGKWDRRLALVHPHGAWVEWRGWAA